VVRSLVEPTMFVVRLAAPTLVLGSSQPLGLLKANVIDAMPVRRRRGGGGLVYLQPDDLWVDWWIPADDVRWSGDVRASSLEVGGWWCDVLRRHVKGEVTLHQGPLEGDPRYRVVCFSGRGPGEVFVDNRKAVGLAQWRVREGIFVTTVLHASPSSGVVDLLADAPAGLEEALDHHVTSTLAVSEPDALIGEVCELSGPWLVRQLFLTT
jgi:lipoate-protein ligase A